MDTDCGCPALKSSPAMASEGSEPAMGSSISTRSVALLVAGRLHVESGFAQIEREALRRKLDRAAAIGTERERRRIEAAAQLVGLVQVADCGEEESITGERLR